MAVYFIKPVGMDGPVKIGAAKLAKDRVHQLAIWSPFELEMVACMEGGQELEGRFHAYFIDDHLRQEWFTASDKIKATIAAIQAGTFDLSVLPPSLGAIRHAARHRATETEEVRVYRQLYAECMALPWFPGHGCHTVPSIFKKYAPERRVQETARIRELIAQRRAKAA